MLITNTPNSELHIYSNDGNEVVTVNDKGIIKGVHPVSKEEKTLFDGAVTTVGDADTEPIVAFSGTAEEFSELYVCVNNERLVYNAGYQSFDDANETVSVLLTDGYIKIFAYNSGTFAIVIKQSTTTVDEGFVEAVQSVVYDDDDGSIITVDASSVPLTDGWHTTMFTVSEYETAGEAESAYNAWASKPNRRIMVRLPIAEDDITAVLDVILTLSANSNGFDLFSGLVGLPVEGMPTAQIHAFPFWDLAGQGYGIIVHCAIKIEHIVASTSEEQTPEVQTYD